KQESKKEGDKAGAPEIDERFPPDVADTVRDWLRYKTERRESYKPTGLKSLLSEIEHQVERRGAEAVCNVIRLSMSNGWRGIIWNKAEGEANDGQRDHATRKLNVTRL